MTAVYMFINALLGDDIIVIWLCFQSTSLTAVLSDSLLMLVVSL